MDRNGSLSGKEVASRVTLKASASGYTVAPMHFADVPCEVTMNDDSPPNNIPVVPPQRTDATAATDPDATQGVPATGHPSGIDVELPQSRLIGPYRLLELLGEGGMGEVWLAEQKEPVRRRLAVKLVKAGMNTREVMLRFESERQALALMDHPAIAKVFDAGSTPQGVPYFVMEYVAGVPITAYCDNHQLSTRERLELFVRVCEGVQHAHQKAIIHRDLKPSNILVTEVDGHPAPKIIDFGVAKALSQRLTADTLYTRVGTLVGTPQYMSPEQTLTSGEDIDTRSDVYSLGVIFYELLAGAPPLDLRQVSLDEVLRRLREEEPPRPSTKLRTQDAVTSTDVARKRHTELPMLVRQMRGDLDAIALKALEKDRARRYGSPSDFAADIGRYLRNEAVLAVPASLAYRATKFVRRQRLPVAAVLLIIASVAAGLYEVNRQRVISQRRFSDVRQLANKLFDIDVQVRDLPGSTKARQLIVDTSLEYLRGLTADVHGDPTLALDVGTAYMRVARVQGVPISPTLGQMDEAEKNLEIADGFIEFVLKKEPANRIAMLRAAQIAHDRMILARFARRSDEAHALARTSADWLDKFQAGKGDEVEGTGILNTYLNVADQFRSDGDDEKALQLSRRGGELATAFNRPASRGNFLWVVASILQARGDLDEALMTIQESVRLLDPGPDWATKINQTLNFYHALTYQGRILGEDNGVSLGRPQDALQPLQKAFDGCDAIVRRDPNDHASRGGLADAAITLGGILRHVDARRALDVYDHALGHLAEVQSDLHLQRYEINLLAGSSYPLRKLGNTSEARQRLETALKRIKELKFYPVDEIDLGSETGETLLALADHESETGNPSRGIEIYQELLSKMDPVESDAQFNLQDAVHVSTIYGLAAKAYRRTHRVDGTSAMERRRLELWERWAQKLPNNAFVRQQLKAASHP